MNGLSDRQRFDLYRQIATFMHDGALTLLDTLELLREVLQSRRGASRRVVPQLAHWIDRLRAGEPFGAIVRETLPTLEASVIGTAHRSGSAEQGFRQAAEIGEQLLGLRRSLQNTIVMPAIMLFELAGSMWYIGQNLGPNLTPIERSIGEGQMPVLLQGLLGFITTMNLLLPLLLLAGAGYLVFVVLTIRGYTGRFRRRLDRLPPFGIYRRWHAAIAFMNLAMLLDSGESLPKALHLVSSTAPRPLRIDIDAMRDAVREGARFEQVMTSPQAATLLPAEYMAQISVYAATSADNLRQHLPGIARRFLAQSAARALVMSNTLAVLTMVATAGLSLWINIAFLALNQSMGLRAF